MRQGKLGKLKAAHDRRTLKLANYFPKRLPAIPPEVRWDLVKPGNKWGVDGNFAYGNCVIATAAHIMDAAEANESGNLNRISDAAVINLSKTMGALNGYVLLNRLKWWRNTGMWGSKIEAFASLASKDDKLLRTAINVFGHADIGLLMPRAWSGQLRWDVGTGAAYRKGSWGGHSVPLIGYRKGQYQTIYYAVTWGYIVEITQAAINAYCDEAYTSILPDWFEHDTLTPSGFRIGELRADIQEID